MKEKCTKRTYFSQREAVHKLKSLQREGNRKESRIYKCEKCNRWHLTSKVRLRDRLQHTGNEEASREMQAAERSSIDLAWRKRLDS